MPDRYSMAEARERFAALVRQVEAEDDPVAVTRRGDTVAVILGLAANRRLAEASRQRQFWDAYQTWRQVWRAAGLDEEVDVWAAVRDKRPGSGDSVGR